MRDYKFRGRRLDNGEWEYGYVLPARNWKRAFIWGSIGQISETIGESGPAKAIGCIEVNPATVGQWTRLHDKNGTEIYEADLLKSTYVYEVHYNDGEWWLRSIDSPHVCKDTAYNLHYALCNLDIKVIGNIHQHPELLEKANPAGS